MEEGMTGFIKDFVESREERMMVWNDDMNIEQRQ